MKYAAEARNTLAELRIARSAGRLTKAEYIELAGWLTWALGGEDEEAARYLAARPGEVPDRYRGTVRDFDNFGAPVLRRRLIFRRPDRNRRLKVETALPRAVEVIAVRVAADIVIIVHIAFQPAVSS